jgi:hypothetical protein
MWFNVWFLCELVNQWFTLDFYLFYFIGDDIKTLSCFSHVFVNWIDLINDKMKLMMIYVLLVGLTFFMCLQSHFLVS